MNIQQIRNATIKLGYGGKVFLVDPWLQDRGSGGSAPAILPEMQGKRMPLDELPFPPAEVLRGVDYLLVSHIHPDHFTPDYLPKDMKLIAQNGADADKFRAMGFAHVERFEGDRLALGEIEIARVDGLHGSTPELAAAMGRASGFILRHPDEKTLYICGDTLLFDGVLDAIAAYRPDVIAVNCCAATTPMGRLLVDDAELLRIVEAADGAQIVATRLDSVNHALLTRRDIRRLKEERGLERLHIPESGEMLRF